MLYIKLQLKDEGFGCRNSEIYDLFWQFNKYLVALFFFLGVSTPIALFISLFIHLNEDIRLQDIHEREHRLVNYEKYVMNKPVQTQKESTKSVLITDLAQEQSGTKSPNRKSTDKSELPMDYYRQKNIGKNLKIIP